jgi:hypothetical protein
LGCAPELVSILVGQTEDLLDASADSLGVHRTPIGQRLERGPPELVPLGN